MQGFWKINLNGYNEKGVKRKKSKKIHLIKGKRGLFYKDGQNLSEKSRKKVFNKVDKPNEKSNTLLVKAFKIRVQVEIFKKNKHDNFISRCKNCEFSYVHGGYCRTPDLKTKTFYCHTGEYTWDITETMHIEVKDVYFIGTYEELVNSTYLSTVLDKNLRDIDDLNFIPRDWGNPKIYGDIPNSDTFTNLEITKFNRFNFVSFFYRRAVKGNSYFYGEINLDKERDLFHKRTKKYKKSISRRSERMRVKRELFDLRKMVA